MDNRKYNIYFNTHTVSGIIICAILYVMFFAGSFSFFKDDLAAWQKNESYLSREVAVEKNFNHILDSLAKQHALKGRDIDFSIQRHQAGAYVSMTASHDPVIQKLKPKKKPEGKRGRGRGRGGDDDSAFFTYDFSKQQEADYASSYTIGEFLYRLHFLAQVNQIFPFRIGVPFGYLLAGIVSFIFLFALITGLLLHWDKIASNFFTFRPWSKRKTVWTDLHTALGVIGFPYQLVFAVTGVVLIFNSFLIIPYTKLFYKGNNEKIYKDLGIGVKQEFAYANKALTVQFDMNSLVAQTEQKWQRSEISLVAIRNFGDDNMHVVIQGKPQTDAQLNGQGELVYRVRDQKIVSEQTPLSPSSYLQTVRGFIYHLHFGDFGGRPLRVVYFVLGILGCIVINSGVMIWLVARDNKSIPERKRKFNFWTANVYISSSLSMLPVTAFCMTALLFLNKPVQSDIYHWYFYPWLALSLYFLARRNLALVNRQSLFLSAVACFLLPLADGIMRGNWFWNTFARNAYNILFIDVLFLCLSIISGLVLWKMDEKKRIQPAAVQINRNVVQPDNA
ncbi:PepSY-associated TM helix domain-containing protein [Spirosoma sp. KUDC1026]|uniref:PepSY-associated TM helix domain-containing protein n=1 Tax=Spirosoma sp. KUDC1026 TaxID=2745947 RepID=UPI00159BD7E3|nr:PepSY-associated TM helix domain-containing protein [Spirosoma sp. KUDC1026]QKZ13210.1 PepSY domain-containing protein [Spirosoma sp. KUDC1026]